MNQATKIVLVIGCSLLIQVPILHGMERTAQRIALPTSEVAAILTTWLTRSGFEVQDAPLETGGRKLSAFKQNESWTISLKPDSVLAADMQAQYTCSATDERAKLNQLSKYLATYLNASVVNQESSNRAIPVTVLSQIRSVVCIEAVLGNQTTQYTGFVVDTDGLIMSTTHGLKGLEEIHIILYDGRRLKGKLIKFDRERDLALVQVASKLESAVSLATGRNLLGMGERVYSVGCPVDLIGTVYSGIVNGPPRRVERMSYWQVDMEIHHGSSGSPVFDVSGNLVGIVKGRFRGTQSIGFLIPLETIIAFVKGS
jgi:serine protease Do